MLGWSLHGPCSDKSGCEGIHTLHICNTTQTHYDYLHDLIKQSFSTEAFGVAAIIPRENVQNGRALEVMETTTKRIGNRYEIGRLCKSDEIELPDIENYLRLDGLKGCIEGTEVDAVKVSQAKATLILTIDPSLHVHIKETTTAEELWKKPK
ncbi:hypothetical protein JTB14_018652 [Gonioctena quinquepunctata]|nr:hypothetical protein JTB14_018652 [Gonioctena quinquepunctata]